MKKKEGMEVQTVLKGQWEYCTWKRHHPAYKESGNWASTVQYTNAKLSNRETDDKRLMISRVSDRERAEKEDEPEWWEKWWRQSYSTQERRSLVSIQLLCNANYHYKQPLSAAAASSAVSKSSSLPHTLQVANWHEALCALWGAAVCIVV